MLIEVHNSISYVKNGTLPVHLYKIFNFILKSDIYASRRTPNLPSKKKSIFFAKQNAFLTGALSLLLKKYPCDVVDHRIKPDVDITTIKAPSWLRKQQVDAFNRMLEVERGIIHHTTASGKTYLCAAWVNTIPCKHLVLVRGKEIMDQFITRFNDVLGDDNYDLIWGKKTRINNNRITLAMIQSFAPRLARHEISVDHYESIIADEGHHIGWQSQYTSVFFLANRALFRFSLTGTPNRELGDQIAHIGMVGPICNKYTYEDALADNLVTPVHVFYVQLPYCPIKPTPLEPYFKFYSESIVKNKVRNDIIANIAVVNMMAGNSTLIICNEVVHEEILFVLIINKLKEKNVPNNDISRSIAMVHSKDKERSQKKLDFENGIIKCLIGSTLYDEGIDIHRIQTIIAAGGGKSERAVKQRVGRGQRLGEDKSIVMVFDFDDTFTKKTGDHAKIRLKYYLDEKYVVEGLKNIH